MCVVDHFLRESQAQGTVANPDGESFSPSHDNNDDEFDMRSEAGGVDRVNRVRDTEDGDIERADRNSTHGSNHSGGRLDSTIRKTVLHSDDEEDFDMNSEAGGSRQTTLSHTVAAQAIVLDMEDDEFDMQSEAGSTQVQEFTDAAINGKGKGKGKGKASSSALPLQAGGSRISAALAMKSSMAGRLSTEPGGSSSEETRIGSKQDVGDLQQSGSIPPTLRTAGGPSSNNNDQRGTSSLDSKRLGTLPVVTREDPAGDNASTNHRTQFQGQMASTESAKQPTPRTQSTQSPRLPSSATPTSRNNFVVGQKFAHDTLEAIQEHVRDNSKFCAAVERSFEEFQKGLTPPSTGHISEVNSNIDACIQKMRDFTVAVHSQKNRVTSARLTVVHAETELNGARETLVQMESELETLRDQLLALLEKKSEILK